MLDLDTTAAGTTTGTQNDRPAILVAGEALYAALGAGDGDTLGRLLAPDFQGTLTAGLPFGLGRTYDGYEAMITEGWGAIGAHFALAPEVEHLWDGGNVLIGQGFYVGRTVNTDRPIRAAFAHFWTFDGTRFTGVTQVTDSAAWAEAVT